MELSKPQPWDDPTHANSADRDYNIKSPLQADGSDFPCRGIDQASTGLSSTATYQAGQSYNMTVEGYANHDGGSCQISLSYDNGKSWKVIKSMIGSCPGKSGGSYGFTIPTNAPSGTALFAWTWINHTGNREFYMNCAVVDIQGSSGGDLCALPNLYVANLKGINSCVSPEGIDTMYPDPGSDVVYSNGMSASSPVTGSSSCEIAAPDCGSSDSSNNSQSPSSESSQPSQESSQSSQYSQSSQQYSQSTQQYLQFEPSSTSSLAKAPKTALASRSGAGPQGSGIANYEVAIASGSPELSSAVEAYIASLLAASVAAATGTGAADLTSLVNDYIASILQVSPSTATPAPVSVIVTPSAFPTAIDSTVATPAPWETAAATVSSTLTATTTDASLISSYIESVLTATPTSAESASSVNTSAPTDAAAISALLPLLTNFTGTSPSTGLPSVVANLFGEVAAQRGSSGGAVMTPGTSCPPQPVVTLYSTASPPPASCTAPVPACDCQMPGDYCAPANECTTMCVGSMTGSSSWSTVVTSSATPYTTTPTTPSPYSSSSPPSSSPSSPPSNRPPYVTTSDPNTAAYLPCTPGAFLCHSADSFYTCDQPAPPSVPPGLAPNGWAWGWERPVAPGMMCLPFERVAHNATEAPGMNGGTGASVRDDRYVRARPDGDCEGVDDVSPIFSHY
ncbi:putative endoglucanase [Diplodia seriata]|uniref:Putative endoglucanase n=1 Tax=Diplodia seriata TaxID=420778 RepID=A0A0G2DTZ7_9PEZI|nr:putative endoglucanase [Diplodia seriata]